MAGTSRRDISIQYRRLEGAILPTQNLSLFAAIAKAMDHESGGRSFRSDWRLRDHQSAEDECLIMNWFVEDEPYFIGEIVAVEPEGLLTAARRSVSTGAFFEVAQIESSEGAEPYLGAVYFLVRDNHVLVVDDGISKKRVDEYLQWLLNDATKVTDNVPIRLTPRVHVEDPRAHSAGATTIQVNPKPFAPPVGSEHQLLHKESGNAAIDVLRAIGFEPYRDFDRLVSEGGDASIVLEIKLKFRGMKSLLPATLVSLDGLAAAFDEDEISLHGEQGSVKGHLVSAHFKANVRIENGQIHKDDIRQAFGEAWDDFVARGLIR